MFLREYIYNELQDVYPPEELKSLAKIISKEILQLSELDCYTGKYADLLTDKRDLLRNAIQRLRQFEPLQYIQGLAPFCGWLFCVAPGVLIPRPETEELAALIIKESSADSRILDIGTGSGCIAITLSKNIPGAVVEGWDVSEKALKIARRNNEELQANVSFCLVDILNDGIENKTFDIIVSNPPYITEKEKADMHPNVLNWEPDLALFVPDNDPLLFYRRIAKVGKNMLSPKGRLYFEINQYYSQETAQMLEDFGYKDIRIVKDLFENDRIITATL
ncbi:peptide chain release factor N(5)-glutamine methyltransferase [Bacteroides sp. 224]|uniref:peptide chain release factor N(5)-glutamine methyltransferase n=1 Tax=Bacteroides sp. 224 TaxID=2302936 RepID=UPI0013D17450|nr:peptide chain release factor N(5)-glutamine methyltransferase [Bacteroides sp. 224]NDV66389.1 peptide chain release factor N(5)-glutamine methyltransferase [Bacteroides sp. 224]